LVERVGILIVFCALDSVAGQRIHEKLRLQGQPEHADERGSPFNAEITEGHATVGMAEP